MDNNELQASNITISAVEQLTWGIKIKDEKGLVYNIAQFLKGTQTETKAYSALMALADNGMNQQKCFKFAVVPNNQNGTSRYVRIIMEPQDNISTPSQTAQNTTNTQNTPPQPVYTEKTEDEKWDKINFGKCKHQFLIEILKHNVKEKVNATDESTMKRAEEIAEEWAKMSMRILEEKTPAPVEVDAVRQGLSSVIHPDEISKDPEGNQGSPGGSYIPEETVEDINVENIPF